MEVIKEIKEIHEGEGYYGGQSGYLIKTDEQEIKVMIDSHQSCCENWGYFMTEDNIDKFIGETLYDVKVVDTAQNKESIPDLDYGGDVMFVDFETSRGVLQFVAYNSHNGYYGHEAIIESRDINESRML